jgi:hypothetical protein
VLKRPVGAGGKFGYSLAFTSDAQVLAVSERPLGNTQVRGVPAGVREVAVNARFVG